jgi:hypothetical protein
MSMTGETTGQLDIGRVIQDLFGVLGRNFVTFLILALILVGLPAVLSGYMQMSFFRQGHLFDWRVTAASLVSGLGALILQGTIIYGTVTDMNGKRASLGACLSVGLGSFLPILGIGILFYLALICGFILLIVPGLMLLVAWCVAVPVYVAERPGIIESFGRSAELTRGNRWRIFALFVLYMVVLIILEAVLGVFGTASRLAAGGTIPAFQALGLTPVLTVASSMVGTVGAAVLYTELRRVRDGVGPAGLAAIFD